jgi:hypothetical protein
MTMWAETAQGTQQARNARVQLRFVVTRRGALGVGVRHLCHPSSVATTTHIAEAAGGFTPVGLQGYDHAISTFLQLCTPEKLFSSPHAQQPKELA